MTKKTRTYSTPKGQVTVDVPSPTPPKERKVKTCSVPNCGQPHRARGYCSSHYNALKADEAASTPPPAAADPASPPAETPAAETPPAATPATGSAWSTVMGAVLGVGLVGAVAGLVAFLRTRQRPAEVLRFPARSRQ
jgi:hypothetical protein